MWINQSAGHARHTAGIESGFTVHEVICKTHQDYLRAVSSCPSWSRRGPGIKEIRIKLCDPLKSYSGSILCNNSLREIPCQSYNKYTYRSYSGSMLCNNSLQEIPCQSYNKYTYRSHSGSMLCNNSLQEIPCQSYNKYTYRSYSGSILCNNSSGRFPVRAITNTHTDHTAGLYYVTIISGDSLPEL